MTILEYVKTLLKKAGVDENNEKFKDFLANEALTKVEVPAEMITGVDNNLISLEVAKNNFGPIKNHYTALALNGVDTLVDQLLDEYGLPDDDKTEFKIEKNTGKRVALLLKKVQTLENKKALADKPDKAAIQKTIDDLNKQVVIANQGKLDAENGYKAKEKSLRLDYSLTNLFGGQKTIFDKLPSDLRTATLRNAIELELQKKSAKIDFDDSGNVVLLRNDGTNYFGENNQTMNLNQFIEQTLAKDNILEKNPPSQITGQTPAIIPQGPQIVNGKVVPERQIAGQSSIFQELMQNAKSDFNNVNGIPQAQ